LFVESKVKNIDENSSSAHHFPLNSLDLDCR
jgi:hypothetical protein